MTSHALVPDLTTGWDDGPSVQVSNRSNGTATLAITFFSGPGDTTAPATRSRIVFRGVFLYRFIDIDLGYEPDNRDDYEFTLIEVTDSALREDVYTRGRWQNEGLERDLRIVLPPDQLRHYRIGFDDHGTYDVLCTEATVEHDVE